MTKELQRTEIEQAIESIASQEMKVIAWAAYKDLVRTEVVTDQSRITEKIAAAHRLLMTVGTLDEEKRKWCMNVIKSVQSISDQAETWKKSQLLQETKELVLKILKHWQLEFSIPDEGYEEARKLVEATFK